MSSTSQTDPYFLAIDLGTTSCKVGVSNAQGELVGFRRREIPLIHPNPLWAEADPHLWWCIVQELVPQAIQEAEVSPGQIAAIGLSGLMHALVPVRSDGEPLANSMLWMDQRCQEECELLAREHGDRIRELTGGLPRTTTSAAKLYWLQRHHPDIVEATHQFLLPKDFIRLKLTGAWATDPSDAGGTALLSRDRSQGWARTYLSEILGVNPTKFPPIIPSLQIAGHTTSATTAIGLHEGIPVVTGGSDVQATVLGANLFVEGRLCLYMGTAAWLAVGLGGHDADIRIRFLGATATFGAAMRWCLETICQRKPTPEAYAQAEAEAACIPPGSEGLICLPHLMGERGPYMSPGATGALFGLTLGHQHTHMFRAVLEGTACQIRHLMEDRGAIKPQELWCIGGGARSQLWLRIIAGVTGLPVVIPQETEAGLLGSAMMAAVGTNHFPSLAVVADTWVRPGPRIEPNLTAEYDSTYQKYRRLDAMMQPLFDEAID